MTWLRPIGGSLVYIQSTHSRFGLWTVRLFIGGDVENVLDVWNLLRERITRKMSENERRRGLREASKTPTAALMEWWTLVALLEENCHTRGGQVLHQSPLGRSCGPMSPALGWWSIARLDSRSWKAPRMRPNQQNTKKPWRILWPRLKGELVFVRLDLFLLQDPELKTEHQETRWKAHNHLSVELQGWTWKLTYKARLHHVPFYLEQKIREKTSNGMKPLK